jgi:hypothetical protein
LEISKLLKENNHLIEEYKLNLNKNISEEDEILYL